jgi:hypothetical protein
MRTHSSKDLFSTVFVVCFAYRYVHIQLFISHTSYAQYVFGSTTNQALGDQGIKRRWPWACVVEWWDRWDADFLSPAASTTYAYVLVPFPTHAMGGSVL